MSKTKPLLTIFLSLFFLILPFHALGVTFINHIFFDTMSSPPFLLSAWKEILLVIIGILGIINLSLSVSWKELKKSIDIIDIFIVIFSIWALLRGFQETGGGISQILLGAKYDLFPIWIFAFFRKMRWSHIEVSKILKYFSVSSILVIALGIIFFFLPSSFFISLGYSSDHSHFTPDKPLAYCQMISNTDICRAQSTLSGPNQLASFLLFIGALFVGYFFLSLQKHNTKSTSSPYIWAGIFLLCGMLFLLTFSRSAWIGAFISMIIFFIKEWKYLFAKIGIGISILLPLLTAGILFLIHPDFFHDTIARSSSNQGHFERSLDGIMFLQEYPWGLGLGDAGPASSRYAENFQGFLPENWYLQIGLETGFLGLFIYLSLFFCIGKYLFQSKEIIHQSFFHAFIAINLMGLLLHSWESSVTSYSFWGILGIIWHQKNISYSS